MASVSNSEWRTRSGVPLEASYGTESLQARGVEDVAAWAGSPGVPPFTRGIRPGGYRDQPWIIGQYSGFGSAADANGRLRLLLQRGQTGLSVALDLPTQMGLDSDHPLSAGEVGKVGVAIDSLADMEALFDGVDLRAVRQVRTTANAIGPIWLALVVAMAESRGLDPNSIRILIQNDVLKEYVARGTYIVAPPAAVALVADTIEYCSEHLPAWTPLAMSGYHMREAGSTAVQELAFTFANGLAYCDAVAARGVPIDAFAPSLFTFLSAGTDLLEEVAKFRAARRVWSRLMDERGATDPDSQALRIFAFSAGSNLTAQQPMNNVVRVSLAALAAVLGGCQTLHTASYDEALGTPTEHAALLALRTQHVILEESGLTGTADPLGGAWAVESLTHDIETEVLALVKRVAELGGAVRCVESGWFSAELADNAYAEQMRVEAGERRVVGVNVYRDDSDELAPEVFTVDPESEARQRASVAAVRARRDARRVDQALGSVRDACHDGANRVPAIIDAVRAYATVGEICATLRDALGAYHASAVR